MVKINKIIQLSAALALVGALYLGYYNHKQNNKLENQIQRVLSANKLGTAHFYGPSSAERTIVHIKQTHRVHELKDVGTDLTKMFEAFEKAKVSSTNSLDLTSISNKLTQISNSYSNTLHSIASSQDRIYNFLDTLRKDNSKLEVYSEGLSIEDYGFYNENISRLQETKKKLERLEFENPLHPKFAEFKRRYLKTEREIVNNAGTRLYFEGKLVERAAEIKADCVENIKALNAKDKIRADLAADKRENNLLEILSKDNQRVGLTIFGASHSWTNNIDQWNAQHKKDRFRLMEVELK